MKLSQIFLLTFLLQNISIECKQKLIDLIKINPHIQTVELSKDPDKKIKSKTSSSYMVSQHMATALEKIQIDLEKSGLGLKLYKILVQKSFIAPYMQNALFQNSYVFVTLIDLKTQKELPMPSPVGSHSSKNDRIHKQSWTPEESKNYTLLEITMKKFGFEPLHNSWWSFKLADSHLITLVP